MSKIKAATMDAQNWKKLSLLTIWENSYQCGEWEEKHKSCPGRTSGMVTVSSCAVCSYGTCTFESCIILSLTYSRVWQVIHVHWFTFHPGWSLQQKVWSPVSHTGQGGRDLWSDSSLAQFSSPWLADLWFALPVKLESRSHSGNLHAISSHLSVGGYSGYGLTKQPFSKPCFLLLPVQIGMWGCADLARI